MFAAKVHPKCPFETVALIGLKVEDLSQVKSHVDDHNCDASTEVVLTQRVVLGPDGNLWLVGLVCNMRRCCKEAMERRDVGEENSLKVMEWIRDAERFCQPSLYRSPRILLASCRSFGMMVTRFAWMQHKLASSNILTR